LPGRRVGVDRRHRCHVDHDAVAHGVAAVAVPAGATANGIAWSGEPDRRRGMCAEAACTTARGRTSSYGGSYKSLSDSRARPPDQASSRLAARCSNRGPRCWMSPASAADGATLARPTSSPSCTPRPVREARHRDRPPGDRSGTSGITAAMLASPVRCDLAP
jgi:hypothetical protein